MACDFTAIKIPGEDKVLVSHPSQGATDPGFGVSQGQSTIRLTGSAINTSLSPLVWSPIAILATLPANLADETYTVTVTVAGPPLCTSNAQLTITPDALADLLFAAASPAIADLGAIVEIINTKPGFIWEQGIHGPVDLLTMDDSVVSPAPQVVSGWGTSRIELKLPASGAYTLQEAIQAHTIRFNDFAQRVPITLKDGIVDPIALTIVLSEPVLAGQQLELLNVMPGFSWSDTQHGVPQLLGQNRAPAPHQLTYVSGWGTQRLILQLPPAAQFPGSNGLFSMFLKFAASPHHILFTIQRVPLPQVLTIKRLTCKTTEDLVGGDELRLALKLDAAPWVSFPVVDLNDGQSHDYDRSLIFLQQAEIRLWDEDFGWGDDDDNLGTNKVSAGDTKTKMTFKDDDADYSLTYSVSALV